MYERWVATEGIVAVIYVCRSELSGERVAELAYRQGLDQPRVELLSTIRAQAEEEARRQLPLPDVQWPHAVTAY